VVAKADATAANFSMQYVDHALTLHVGLEANFEFGYSEFNLHGHLSLGLDLTTDFHGVNIRGHAEVTGGFTVGLISADFSVLKATVDNNGFAISLPCNNKLRVKW